MAAYYNENNPYVAEWLRQQIAAGMIALGDVDERSIEDVPADDLRGYTQCHFFAGLGGWSHAAGTAGIDDNTAIWTGSAPCQPFSGAGLRRGTDDPRHLWPVWYHLIQQCRPAIIFGEQVAGPLGRGWLENVSADLENLGYAVGAADLCAASVGAPHIRQRLFFVAHTHSAGLAVGTDKPDDNAVSTPQRGCDAGGVADSHRERWHRWGAGQAGTESGPLERSAGFCSTVSLANTVERAPGHESRNNGGPITPHGGWGNCDWLRCRDGKWRPVEPGSLPLAHGVSARNDQLRAIGNAIVPQVAAVFIGAAVDAIAAMQEAA